MSLRHHAKKRVEILDRLLTNAIEEFKPSHVIRKLQIKLEMAEKALRKMPIKGFVK